MSHYKSNIRDIEFNLFEVLGRDEVLGTGPFESIDARDRALDPDRGGAAGPRGPRRVVRGQRPQPAGLRPRDPHRAAARVVQEELPGLARRGVLAPAAARGARRHPCSLHLSPPLQPDLGLGELVLGANAPIWMYGAGPALRRRSCTATATTATSRSRSIIIDKGWNTTMVLTEPDAGSDVGAGRAKATLNDDGTWNITGVKRFITSGRERPVRQHHPPRPRPPRRASRASAARAPRA